MVRGVLALKNLRGLVLETFGAGNAPEDGELIGVLKEGAQNGVVIVNVTQCQVGSVSPLYASATSLARAGVVFGLDMTSEGICFNTQLLFTIHWLCPIDLICYLSCFFLFACGNPVSWKCLIGRHLDSGPLYSFRGGSIDLR